MAARPARNKTQTSAQQYCLDLVRKHDREGFLCAMILPKELRRGVLAVNALSIELARISDLAREPAAREMRFLFWKDLIKEAVKGASPTPQPVGLELARAVSACDANVRTSIGTHLTRLMSARKKHAADAAPDTIYDLERQADGTCGTVLAATLELGGFGGVAGDHWTSHMGKCQGIIRVMRGVQVLSSQRTVRIPHALLQGHGLSQEDVIRVSKPEPLKDVMYELGCAAKSHANTARRLASELDPKATKLLFPLIPCETYLEHAERLQFDVTDKRWPQNTPLLPLILWWRSVRGKL